MTLGEVFRNWKTLWIVRKAAVRAAREVCGGPLGRRSLGDLLPGLLGRMRGNSRVPLDHVNVLPGGAIQCSSTTVSD
jgi:hypothetical protein